MQDDDVSALIVGGSLVGLSTALFLAQQGVSCRLVERHQGTSNYRRAWGLNPRTMELFRGLGMEDAIRESERTILREGMHDGEIVKAESLVGKRIISFNVGDFSDVSRGRWGICPQNLLEPIMRERARRLGVDLDYRTEFRSFREMGDGRLEARVCDLDSGRERSFRTRWLIAADGPRGTLRESLGIALQGSNELSQHMTIGFRADLDGVLDGRNVLLCHVDLGSMFSVLIPEDRTGLWQFDVRYDPRVDAVDEFSDEQWADLIRRAVGVGSIEPRIEYRVPWQTAARVAQRFQQGNVFLVGDAAHVMPPTGGLGANTGIQDAHNLAWKMAAVLRGSASSRLLDTYDEERQPMGAFAVGQAVARYGARLGYEDADLPSMVDEVTLWFGHRYRSAAVIGEGEAPRQRLWQNPRRPTGEAGCRAPHVDLERDGVRLSTHDLFGASFALLAGEGGERWRAAAAAVGERVGAKVAFHQVGVDVADLDGAFPARYGLEAGGATLVRPDGFVGWRTRTRVHDETQALETAMARLLSQPQQAFSEVNGGK